MIELEAVSTHAGEFQLHDISLAIETRAWGTKMLFAYIPYLLCLQLYGILKLII